MRFIGRPIVAERNESGRVARTEITSVTAQLHDELQRLFDLAESRVG